MELLADVKKRVRALLISSKGGCSPKQIYQDYRVVIGEYIPYQELGYRSLMAFMYDIPDVVTVKLTRDNRTMLYAIADEKTQHISRMVSRQKTSRSPGSVVVQTPRRKPPPRRIPDTFSVQLKQLFLSYPNGVSLERFNEAFARRFGYYLKFHSWGYTTLEQLLEDAQEVELVRDPLRGSAVVKPRRKNLALQLDKKVPPHESLNALETSPVKEKKSLSDSQKAKSTDEAENKMPTKPPIPDRLIRNIRELLDANPAGVWLSQFSSHYKDYFGEDLPVFTQGYSSPLHLLSSLTHCCVIERPQVGNGDWLVVAVGAMVKVAPNHGYISAAYISDGLAATITHILAMNPGGVPLRSFLSTYKDYTGKDLQMRELGFNTLVQLLERVEGVRVMKPPDAGFMMVYGPKKKKKKEEVSGREAASSSDGCVSSESEEPPRPPGSMASAYTKQDIPANKVLGVYVTHVHTPSCLCVQLIGENTTRTLEYLLEDLTQFYNTSKGDAYMLKKPRIGQPCCTLFNNDGYWYRAEVVGLPSSDISEVLYVDYGNTGRVPTTSLRRPKPHYMTLPAQAVKCRLAHLKPAGSTWSRQAAQLLFQMTKDKPIAAIISAVTDGVISASLCDTNTDEDIHINDTLVSQGVAIFVKDTEEEQRKFDGYQPEPTPKGATGDHIPDVRIPSHEGGVSHPPTAAPSPTPHLPTPPSILPTPPPTPAPPGLPTLTPSQDPAQLMQNYLLSQQLLIQQAFLSGMTSVQPTALSPNPFQSGQTGCNPSLFAPIPHAPGQTGTANSAPAAQPTSNSSTLQPSQNCSTPQPPQNCSTPQPPQNCSTSVPDPGDSSTSGSPDESPPPRLASAPATRNENTAAKGGKSENEGTKGVREEKHKLPLLLWVKKCQLTDKHSLHVLRHNSRAYVLSQQVSEWFWDTDLLQSMLRQVQKPVWGLLLQDHRAVALFREMKKIPQLRALLYGRREVTVYALEDVPSITSMFHAPESLCAAVREESHRWLQDGQAYFSDNANAELETVTAALKELQVKRQQILSSLAVEDDQGEGDIQEGAQQLVDVTKTISRLKATRAKLLQEATNHRDDVSGGEGGTNSKHVSKNSSVTLSSSSRSRYCGSASQVSDYDDMFYSCASTLSSTTPETVSQVALTSSEFIPGYDEFATVPLSPFHSSSSSSFSPLSDSSVFFPPSSLKPHNDGIVTEKKNTAVHSTGMTACGEVVDQNEEGESQMLTAGHYQNGIPTLNRDGLVMCMSREQTSKHTLAMSEERENTLCLSEEPKVTVSGQSAARIRSCSSGQSAARMRSCPAGQSAAGMRSCPAGQKATVQSRAISSGQNQYTMRTGSFSGHTTTRTSSSSGRGSFRTGWKQQSKSAEQDNQSASLGQPSNRFTKRANPPRMRQGSQKYQPSLYGSRPSLLGEYGSRTASSGRHKPTSRSSRCENIDFNFSSPSSSGFSSPSDSVFNFPTSNPSHTSTDVTCSNCHSSTPHTSTDVVQSNCHSSTPHTSTDVTRSNCHSSTPHTSTDVTLPNRHSSTSHTSAVSYTSTHSNRHSCTPRTSTHFNRHPSTPPTSYTSTHFNRHPSTPHTSTAYHTSADVTQSSHHSTPHASTVSYTSTHFNRHPSTPHTSTAYHTSTDVTQSSHHSTPHASTVSYTSTHFNRHPSTPHTSTAYHTSTDVTQSSRHSTPHASTVSYTSTHFNRHPSTPHTSTAYHTSTNVTQSTRHSTPHASTVSYTSTHSNHHSFSPPTSTAYHTSTDVTPSNHHSSTHHTSTVPCQDMMACGTTSYHLESTNVEIDFPAEDWDDLEDDEEGGAYEEVLSGQCVEGEGGGDKVMSDGEEELVELVSEEVMEGADSEMETVGKDEQIHELENMSFVNEEFERREGEHVGESDEAEVELETSVVNEKEEEHVSKSDEAEVELETEALSRTAGGEVWEADKWSNELELKELPEDMTELTPEEQRGRDEEMTGESASLSEAEVNELPGRSQNMTELTPQERRGDEEVTEERVALSEAEVNELPGRSQNMTKLTSEEQRGDEEEEGGSVALSEAEVKVRPDRGQSTAEVTLSVEEKGREEGDEGATQSEVKIESPMEEGKYECEISNTAARVSPDETELDFNVLASSQSGNRNDHPEDESDTMEETKSVRLALVEPLVQPNIPEKTKKEPFIPSIVRQYPQSFIDSQPQGLVGWKNRRSIGLGRGNPVDNPRAFMFPGYPFPGDPSFDPAAFIPSTPFYHGNWQIMSPQQPQ